jgi:ferredoxin
MTLLIVDQEKCNRDGICAAVCPAHIINWKSGEDYPEMIPGGEEICISCGHCVAACPHGAMNHKQMAAADCPPVKKEWLLGPEQTEHFLRNRRSMTIQNIRTRTQPRRGGTRTRTRKGAKCSTMKNLMYIVSA